MTQPRYIRKRNGITLEDFNFTKVTTAIDKASEAAHHRLDIVSIVEVAQDAVDNLHTETVDVEAVQDAVETALMRRGYTQIAKAYILYRQERAEKRALTPSTKAISDYIHASKYARYLPELRRRETYLETVARVEAMHIRRFPQLEADIRWAFGLVREQRVLPSMRSMQFAGEAIEKCNNRIFNCSASLIDRPRAFAEALYLLLCGCGVGYSVQVQHVAKLPTIAILNRHNVTHHTIEDSIEGWADALDALVKGAINGVYVEFAYNNIRPAGTPLKTSGGRAPGHLKLKESLERIRTVLAGAQGRKLRPIECHRILCHAADAVLSGGIRRSAMIALFSLEDEEMLNAKTGNWWERDPWFANANNSVVLKRDEVNEAQFKRVFSMTKQWGEPGFFFTASYDYATNPCCEIGLNPKLGEFTGWAFCNLCEINGAKLESVVDFMSAVRAAATIGTLQASYTLMPYLGWVSEELACREALLGVGITGMLDSPKIALDPNLQRIMSDLAVCWNKIVAGEIDISPAARVTCVKPSGTTSLELGCVGSGIHPHHAKRYIRRVTADELEPVFQAFREKNPHMCVRKPDGKWVVEFAVEAPEGAILKEDLSAIEFLELVKSTQQNWVIPGTADDTYSPGLTHNVSNTVLVKPNEWEAVADYLWENKEFFTGVSLLPSSGDKDYAFAPMESVVTEADEARWNEIVRKYQPVDYASLVELEDRTALTAEAACAGGVCEVV